MLSLSRAFTFICLISLASTAAAQEPTRIMSGFVPELDMLEFVRGEDLPTVYEGETVKGIYYDVRVEDQRFVETHTKDRRTRYMEQQFASDGTWFVRGDESCYVYDEDESGFEHCFHIFRYGDCLISYSSNLPVIRGLPLFPSQWGSVQAFTSEDFRWPDTPASDRDAFTCRLAMS